MNRLLKIALTTYAFFLSAVSVVFILITLDQEMLAGIYMLMYTQVLSSPPIRWLVFGVSVFLFVSSAGFLVYGLQSDRLRRTRIRSNDVGVIDIDVDAIESIALNSAKTAQCGIKQAKARVASVKGGKLTIRLTAVLYSDVEIPAMMTKVQERIKKDIERYTAIPVAGVSVKVSRVEPVAARVER
jgi:uncharacterized alkaline shock family protein YloU